MILLDCRSSLNSGIIVVNELLKKKYKHFLGTPDERGLTKWKKGIFSSIPNISVEVNSTTDTDIDLELNIQTNVTGLTGLTETGDGEENEKIGKAQPMKKGSDGNDNPGSDVRGDIYDLPFIMNFIRRNKVFTYVPISPTFRGYLFARRRCYWVDFVYLWLQNWPSNKQFIDLNLNINI